MTMNTHMQLRSAAKSERHTNIDKTEGTTQKRMAEAGGENGQATNAAKITQITDATILRSAVPTGTHNTGDVQFGHCACGASEVFGASAWSCPIRFL